MVKVIGVSREEQARNDRVSKLSKLAESVFLDKEVRTGAGGVFVQDIKVSDGRTSVEIPIAITPELNQINLYSETYLDKAMNLGFVYERAEGKEWTVKKCYELERYEKATG